MNELQVQWMQECNVCDLIWRSMKEEARKESRNNQEVKMCKANEQVHVIDRRR